MKKKIFGGAIVTLIVLSISCMFIRNVQKDKAEKEYDLQRLYNMQNTAFGISRDSYSESIHYHGSDELDISRLEICLYVFSKAKPNNALGVKDIQEYLSCEYDDEGNLRIYSQPEDIALYIRWFCEGGSEDVLDFTSKINSYLENNGYKCDYTELSLEDLQEILTLVSE
ncbi:hypothetical protein [Butyrivibrio proteoclasticus]|uniref:hypothetical protein n=1 Tax=Butyrivibrio proteoclasticus TaxID=43305 RepID=UPI00047AC72D|nr:hypothetical protein [Butyrivibrio proteoclasticus]